MSTKIKSNINPNHPETKRNPDYSCTGNFVLLGSMIIVFGCAGLYFLFFH